MSHAVLAPSSADIWVNCPGSIKMGEGVVEEETDDSREGDAVHWLAESALTQSMFVLTDAKDIIAPNGVVITDEMIDAAITYAQEVHSAEGELHVEEVVQMPEIHEQCWGTPDSWIWNPQQLRLYVKDLKYGHSSVDAFEHWQLICYAVGILRTVTNNNPLSEHINILIDFDIVQPRCYDGKGPVRNWQIYSQDLRAYVNKLAASAEAAFTINPLLNTGSHCKHCKARHKCPALLKSSAKAVDYAGATAQHNLSPIALAYEIGVLRDAADMIQFRKSALETEALSRIQAGELIPGLGAEHGLSRNKWVSKPEEVITMCKLMGVDVKKPVEPLTPTQAIVKFKKEDVDPEVIKSYYGRLPTSAKLVVDDLTRAKQIFSKEKLNVPATN